MIEARWNGALIASSDATIVVEGNEYFPASAVDAGLLRPSDTTTFCPWKGTAHYHHLHVDGAENRDAAWYYPDPKTEAENKLGEDAEPGALNREDPALELDDSVVAREGSAPVTNTQYAMSLYPYWYQ